ncbi:putative cobalamin B12-binding domain-containing protein [Magnetofaba australis IT-1]|uniref:Putative cobalamin B12-binding domain-containing protein n=1 Tax=Magnetofaba australis IT-1 TaxID=1434232 RepID=A0A1Y2JZ53_9PROT|nr:putative cobalamin B12-binding domain-containing protein [Magnetofaba australis IT-1]
MQLCEFNVLMGNVTFLPLVSGLLQGAAQRNDRIRQQCEFLPFRFHVQPLEQVLKDMGPVDVAAFSVSMWNEQLSLNTARAIKEANPECIILFGGVQVPYDAQRYFDEHPYIDVTVRGEGEDTFTLLLERIIEGRGFDGVPGISWKEINGQVVREPLEAHPSRDLDEYPSPYLSGLYDQLMANNPHIEFQAIIETNRGCPYGCTFCNWGKGGLSEKYRFHSLERVQAEIRWFAENNIRYVFNADSNFGAHRRDSEIAQYLVDTKQEFGFPEKFRTCYGKNTDEKIFAIAQLFHAYELEKGITISPQSYNPETLSHIKRKNIKLETMGTLQRRFNEAEIPVYSELILGLPGETLESWRKGIEVMLCSGLKNQLFLYFCELYENTEMTHPDYIQRHQIRSIRLPVNEIHASVRNSALVSEYYDMVVSTATMPQADWERAVIFNWTTMLLHSMKAGFFWLAWMHDRFGVDYIAIIDALIAGEWPEAQQSWMQSVYISDCRAHLGRMLTGQGRGVEKPEYGEIYWEPEEVGFVQICQQTDRVYDELAAFTSWFLTQQGVAFDPEEMREAILYQKLRLPTLHPPAELNIAFDYNLPQYFDRITGNEPIAVARQPQTLIIEERLFDPDDLKTFMRKNVLWGRKSGANILQAQWRNDSGLELEKRAANA